MSQGAHYSLLQPSVWYLDFIKIADRGLYLSKALAQSCMISSVLQTNSEGGLFALVIVIGYLLGEGTQRGQVPWKWDLLDGNVPSQDIQMVTQGAQVQTEPQGTSAIQTGKKLSRKDLRVLKSPRH